MEMVWFSRENIVPEGGARVKVRGGVPVIVVRHNGNLHAYVAVCDHKYYVLCEKALKGDRIVCPGHGEEFMIPSGEPTRGMAKSPLIKLKLEVRNGDIYVEKPGREILEKLAESTSVE
ncbi:MAG: Rieske 2Fe-2S domain-containing protein [Sulfolobales archaeon]|jgi:nitrite reductase/ring-hydroxylating ferredoxin subunit